MNRSLFVAFYLSLFTFTSLANSAPVSAQAPQSSKSGDAANAARETLHET